MTGVVMLSESCSYLSNGLMTTSIASTLESIGLCDYLLVWELGSKALKVSSQQMEEHNHWSLCGSRRRHLNCLFSAIKGIDKRRGDPFVISQRFFNYSDVEREGEGERDRHSTQGVKQREKCRSRSLPICYITHA